MGEDKQKKFWQSLRKKLKVTYRLVVMNDDTFEEVDAYRLNLLNIYLLISSVIVSLTLLIVMVIVFTPLKNYIPGYGDFDALEKSVQLEKQLSELRNEVKTYELWSSNIKKILTGNVDTVGSFAHLDSNKTSDLGFSVPKVVEDEDLRKAQEEDFDEETPRIVNLPPQEIPLGQRYFTPPVSGEISFAFSPEKKHLGVDVIAPKNTPVKSVMDGFVLFSDWSLETGNTICIQHKDNLVSFYKHNSALLKSEGDIVKAGEAIAIIGNTGTHSTGPHLHFELWHQGKPVDPMDFVNFN